MKDDFTLPAFGIGFLYESGRCVGRLALVLVEGIKQVAEGRKEYFNIKTFNLIYASP